MTLQVSKEPQNEPDHFNRVEPGQGKANSIDEPFPLSDGDVIAIPVGTGHSFISTSTG